MAAATAALPFTEALASGVFEAAKNNYPIAFFTKPLDDYDLVFMAETLAMAGVDGFDLTVRPNGRVEPVRILDDLPTVIEIGRKNNLKTEMMVTSITDPLDTNAERILKTAANYGIKHYRLGYYYYDFKKGVVRSLDEIKTKLELLAKLNLEAGIQGGYQNHSGTRVGAPMWDVWYMMQNISPELISSQFDIRHATTESLSSWIIAMNLLNKKIGSLAIKDFTWDISGGKAKVTSVPLGEGLVDFDLFFRMIKDMNIIAPITLHVEYPLLDKGDETLSLLQKQKIIVTKLKKEVDFIHSFLNKYKL